jgi:hypothetical protein
MGQPITPAITKEEEEVVMMPSSIASKIWRKGVIL